MLSFVYGEVAEIYEDSVVLDVGGVGYQIYIPSSLHGSLPRIGEDLRLYTYLNINLQGTGDVVTLYGFPTREDLRLFRLCLSVSGIGPRAALGLLGSLTPDQLRFAVLAEDVKAISKAPGIGPKSAKKLILELKDKLSLEEAFELKLNRGEEAAVPESSAASEEAVQALVSLGYSASDALKAVRQAAPAPEDDAEAILKKALKSMALF